MQKWYFHDISVDDNSYNSENKQLYELSGSFNMMVTLLLVAKLQEFTSIWVWHLRSFITARVSFDQLIEISFFCVGILFYITFVKLLCSLGTVSYLKCCTIQSALRWNISSPIFYILYYCISLWYLRISRDWWWGRGVSWGFDHIGKDWTHRTVPRIYPKSAYLTRLVLKT